MPRRTAGARRASLRSPPRTSPGASSLSRPWSPSARTIISQLWRACLRSFMTLTSASNEKYEWSLCGDVAKDLVGWQCRTSSSRPDDNGVVDVSKTSQVWARSDPRLCTERPTCEDVDHICSRFFNTTASECTGTATGTATGTTPCSTNRTQPGCTGCTWTDGSKGAPGTCSGTATTLCSVAFRAASDDKQSSCATGSPGTTWNGRAIPGCKYTRKDWEKGKCATADGTPFKSSILKQSQIERWQSHQFSVGDMTYVGSCQNDDSDATGTGTGPDRWPAGSQHSTTLIYGGLGGFSLTIEDYVDGTGLDIKGAASTACDVKQTDCTVPTQDLTSGGNVKVRDAPKDTAMLKTKNVQVYPCPDKQACGTGAGGGLPVLFVFAMLGTTPRHRIPMLALSR